MNMLPTFPRNRGLFTPDARWSTECVFGADSDWLDTGEQRYMRPTTSSLAKRRLPAHDPLPLSAARTYSPFLPDPPRSLSYERTLDTIPEEEYFDCRDVAHWASAASSRWLQGANPPMSARTDRDLELRCGDPVAFTLENDSGEAMFEAATDRDGMFVFRVFEDGTLWPVPSQDLEEQEDRNMGLEIQSLADSALFRTHSGPRRRRFRFRRWLGIVAGVWTGLALMKLI